MPGKTKKEANRNLLEKVFDTIFPGLVNTEKVLKKAGSGSQNGKKKKRAPAHSDIIKALKNGMWLAVSGGYASGGRPTIDGNVGDLHLATFRFAGTLVFPFARTHALKLVLASSKRIEEGPDYDNVVLAYQYRWGGR